MQSGSHESIFWFGKEYELLSNMFYHLADRDSLLLWNARIGRGVVTSVSVTATTAGLEAATTPYHFTRQQNPKEQIWEAIRRSEFPSKPSRLKALFLFDALEATLKAQELWFPKEGRHLLRTRIISGAQTHVGDARWLDSLQKEWEEKARKYWSGEMTDDPMPELILHGAVYFPDWEEPPFGMLGGASMNPNAQG